VSVTEKKMWRIVKIRGTNPGTNCSVFQIYPYVPPGHTSFCAEKGYRMDLIDVSYHLNVGLKRNGNNALNEFRLIGTSTIPEGPFYDAGETWCNYSVTTPVWP
jgi:hypothetical protein